MDEHTPGPWAAINLGDAIEIRAPSDWVIAVTVAAGAPDAEDLANAQLIAAAQGEASNGPQSD